MNSQPHVSSISSSSSSYFLQQPHQQQQYLVNHPPLQSPGLITSSSSPSMMVPSSLQPQRRRIWIRQRLVASCSSSSSSLTYTQPTSIIITRDTIADDLKTHILQKFNNTIGKYFDSFQLNLKLEVPEKLHQKLVTSSQGIAGSYNQTSNQKKCCSSVSPTMLNHNTPVNNTTSNIYSPIETESNTLVAKKSSSDTTSGKSKPSISLAFPNNINNNITNTGTKSPLSPMPISSQKSSLINVEGLNNDLTKDIASGLIEKNSKKLLVSLLPDQNIWEFIDLHFPHYINQTFSSSSGIQQLSVDYCFIVETPTATIPKHPIRLNHTGSITQEQQPDSSTPLSRSNTLPQRPSSSIDPTRNYNNNEYSQIIPHHPVIPEYQEDTEPPTPTNIQSSTSPINYSQTGHTRRYHSISTTEQYYTQTPQQQQQPNAANSNRRLMTPHTAIHRRSQSANNHYSSKSTTPTPYNDHQSVMLNNKYAHNNRSISAMGATQTSSPSSVLLLPSSENPSNSIPGSWKGNSYNNNNNNNKNGIMMISPLIESPESELPLVGSNFIKQQQTLVNGGVLESNVATATADKSPTKSSFQSDQTNTATTTNNNKNNNQSITKTNDHPISNSVSAAAPITLSKILPSISVLIVEDNQINLRILSAHLRRHKIHHDTAKNGQEAIDKWRLGGFHLILMDIQLPVLSGLEASMEIRRLERVNGIGGVKPLEELEQKDMLDMRQKFKSPVIIVALTASNLKQDKTEALASGCNDYLTKPVNFEWLLNKITEWGCMQALIDFDGWKFGQGRIINTTVGYNNNKNTTK